jgi:hypothetical protein
MNFLAKKKLALIMVVVSGFFIAACGKKSNPSLPVHVAPNPVKNFKAIVRSDAVLLLWKSPRKNTNDSQLIDLAGFNVLRSEMPVDQVCLKCPRDFIQLFDYDYTGQRGKVPGSQWFYYYDRSIKFGTFYTYKIVCYTEKKTPSPPSAFRNVYCYAPPDPPFRVRAKRKNKIVIIEWDLPRLFKHDTPAQNIKGYNVYRRVEESTYDLFPINKEIIKDAFFEDIPEKEDKVYFYTVRALRQANDTLLESATSEETKMAYMDTTAPGIPRAVTAIPVEDGILLKWILQAEGDFAGFNLYRKEPKDEKFLRLNVKLTKNNSWIDKTAKIRKSYIYGVTSVDSSAQANESKISDTVKVKYILK